jgi:hypothetical protein
MTTMRDLPLRLVTGAAPHNVRSCTKGCCSSLKSVITLQRAFGQPPAHFKITRIGDGIQISANGT